VNWELCIQLLYSCCVSIDCWGKVKGSFVYCDKKRICRGSSPEALMDVKPLGLHDIVQKMAKKSNDCVGIWTPSVLVKNYCIIMDDDALLFKRHHINPWISGSMESFSFEELEECLKHRGRSRIRKRSIIPGIYGGYNCKANRDSFFFFVIFSFIMLSCRH
jgi:hypothetical protein